jgi:hypothetical protein
MVLPRSLFFTNLNLLMGAIETGTNRKKEIESSDFQNNIMNNSNHYDQYRQTRVRYPLRQINNSSRESKMSSHMKALRPQFIKNGSQIVAHGFTGLSVTSAVAISQHS